MKINDMKSRKSIKDCGCFFWRGGRLKLGGGGEGGGGGEVEEKRRSRRRRRRRGGEEEEEKEEEDKTVNANLKLNCKSATPLYAAICLKNPHGNGHYK